jgi:hypothetical protein
MNERMSESCAPTAGHSFIRVAFVEAICCLVKLAGSFFAEQSLVSDCASVGFPKTETTRQVRVPALLPRYGFG